jgi:hypothetical protein
MANVRTFAKRVFLYLGRSVGLFAAARWLTREKLRILCYHGFALGDEARFRPGLFIEDHTFSRRIGYLLRKQFPLLPLGTALALLDEGRLAAGATVITIDDGFFGTLQAARSHLAPEGLPAVLYATSYYCDKQTPVFRLVVQYMFWKTRETELDLGRLGIPSPQVVPLGDEAKAAHAAETIMTYGQERLDEPGRCRLARRLGECLGVEYDDLVASRRFGLLSADELRDLESLGIDVQLHTHRHRFPVDESQAQRELSDNRHWLSNVVASRLEHFCYPSGEWSPEHLPWLAAAGITSATTCDAGLNGPETPRLTLHRFLDGEHVAQIEFEAEMSGFSEVARRLRDGLRSLAGAKTQAKQESSLPCCLAPNALSSHG